MRLGDILKAQGLVDDQQLQAALAIQQKTKQRLGDILTETGVTTETQITNALHSQLGIDVIELRGIKIPPEVITLVSGTILRKHKVLPVGFDENDSNTLILAMADPLDMVAMDDIAIITNRRIEPRVATVGAINSVLDRYFGTEEVMTVAEQYTKERELQQQVAEEAAQQAELELSSAPIVQLVKTMIEQAVRQRASDIHIEALEKKVRVRFRIDGIMIEKMMYDAALLAAIVTRIKILARMDISEKRKPQDGRLTVIVDQSEYDVRVSALPTSYGEKVVMRLASASGLTRDKSELGFRDWEMKKFNRMLKNPNGMLLVTGPTGSGKSTTLYTALSELTREEVNIVTVEDPVEANISGINQVQVNPKAELTFASALRAILRQDPDIIMIGEILDYETGHLVVSTLHTNSSSATVTRLIDMGVESFLLADSLVGVIAQRLVRRLCTACRQQRPATDYEKGVLGVDPRLPLTIYAPTGCHLCGDSGYYGRIGVYEIMEITPALKRIIANRGTTEQIKEQAIKDGMHTLRRSAAEYVVDGTTSVSEMVQVSFES
jgi:type IV pilus assembly protein PilB